VAAIRFIWAVDSARTVYDNYLTLKICKWKVTGAKVLQPTRICDLKIHKPHTAKNVGGEC